MIIADKIIAEIFIDMLWPVMMSTFHVQWYTDSWQGASQACGGLEFNIL